MERWIVKLIVLNIIFVVVFGVTLLPLKVATYFRRQGKRGKAIISHMMCFGGGVFFAMYMLQMTPASMDIIKEYLVDAYDIQYPLAEFIIGCGFLLMLLSEVTLNWLGKDHKSKDNKRLMQNKVPAIRSSPCNNQTVYNDLEDVFETDNIDPEMLSERTDMPHHHDKIFTPSTFTEEIETSGRTCSEPSVNQRPKGFPKLLNKTYQQSCREDEEFRGSTKSPAGPLMSFTSNDGTTPLLSVSSPTGMNPLFSLHSTKYINPLISTGIKAGLAPLLCISFNPHLHHQFSIISNFNSEPPNSPMVNENTLAEYTTEHVHASRSLVLLFALSLHHVFEGLSIGLKHSTIEVWHMCIAIVSHEIIVSFSLGMQLIHTFESTTKIVLASFICSVMSPIGIAAGMAIMETGGQESISIQIANGLLQSLATGIFIYVTFFEILQDEFGHNKANFVKIMWLSIGFLILSSLGLLNASSDDEEIGDITANLTEFFYNDTQAVTGS